MENNGDFKVLPFEAEGDQYVDEVTITEDEKECLGIDLSAGFEDLLYEQWRDEKLGIDEHYQHE